MARYRPDKEGPYTGMSRIQVPGIHRSDTALLYLLQRPVGMFSLLAANAGKKAFGLVLVVIYGDIISME